MNSNAEIAAALAGMPDHELHALRANIDSESVIAPGLQTWLVAATNWEIARRAGAHAQLPVPCAGMAIAEVECSLVSLAILYASFRDVAAVADFLDATAEVLCRRLDVSSWDVH